eukprot:1094473-Pelagomonas_calceolata.AAC.1
MGGSASLSMPMQLSLHPPRTTYPRATAWWHCTTRWVIARTRGLAIEKYLFSLPLVPAILPETANGPSFLWFHRHKVFVRGQAEAVRAPP